MLGSCKICQKKEIKKKTSWNLWFGQPDCGCCSSQLLGFTVGPSTHCVPGVGTLNFVLTNPMQHLSMVLMCFKIKDAVRKKKKEIVFVILPTGTIYFCN